MTTTLQLELPTVWTKPHWPTAATSHAPAPSLILSIFPGIDLLGMGFEQEGFCVVRGPDIIYGGDIRSFHPPASHIAGIIGGSPCPDFSAALRTPPSGYGLEMLMHWSRVVTEAAPQWALLENVPRCPDLEIPGYFRQRIDVRGTEVGLRQKRIRHFQFFTRDGKPLPVLRAVTPTVLEPAATATEGRRKHRRTWQQFCEIQGLPFPPELPGMTKVAKYRAVGNGVPLPMARLLARSIRAWQVTPNRVALCDCGCGRQITGRQLAATAACRKRLERRRRSHTTNQGNGVPCHEKDPPALF